LTRAGAVVYIKRVDDADDSSGLSTFDLAGPAALATAPAPAASPAPAPAQVLAAKPKRPASRALLLAGIVALIGIGVGTGLGLFIAESDLVSPAGGEGKEGSPHLAFQPAKEPERAAMPEPASAQAPDDQPQREPESKAKPTPTPIPKADPKPEPVPASSASRALSAVTDADDVVDGPVAAGGPFGLRMGLDEAELAMVSGDWNNGTVVLEQVPAPREDFVEFRARLGSETGLCWFKAFGAKVDTTADGAALRETFEDLEAELDSRHGPHRRTALLLPSSTLAEPARWMQSLAQNERYLFSVWSRATGAKPADELARIVLRATAQSEDAGRISIEYGFSNEAQCDAEIAALGIP